MLVWDRKRDAWWRMLVCHRREISWWRMLVCHRCGCWCAINVTDGVGWSSGDPGREDGDCRRERRLRERGREH
jgi:anaerobic selenocysteine-containing dehydrogenase